MRWSAVRRHLSTPERIGLFGAGVLLAGAVWPTVIEATGIGLPCPLRALTGVPCPGCGLTTGAVALAHGQIGAALAANPVILGIGALAVSTVVLLSLRAFGIVPPPVPWSARRRRRAGWGVALLALASWVFQLNRLGLG